MESTRNPKVLICWHERPAWLPIFWQLGVSFARLDTLACQAVSETRAGIENIRLQQQCMEPVLTDEVLEGSFAQELPNIDLAKCLQDEFEELKLTLLETCCMIFSDMARVALLSPHASAVPKSVGDTMFNPKNHLHSGADVRWNHLPQRVVTWALTHPPVPERVISREAPSS